MAESKSPRSTLSLDWLDALVLTFVALLWMSASAGFVSSNDGSHVALARALALRGATTIDPDVALTLGVDRATRVGHTYSDRPPGTAWLAMPAIAIGARLDDACLARTLANGNPTWKPAGDRYARTYAKRFPRAPPLLGLQGTAFMASAHAVAMGVLGLIAMTMLARMQGASRRASRLALVIIATATLWGPYSTTLFSHVTTGTLTIALLLALEYPRTNGASGPHPTESIPLPRTRSNVISWLAAGGCAALSIASDYSVTAWVVPLMILRTPWRHWWLLILGAAPIALALAAYHEAAFGDAFAIGYDFHSNFEFARSRVGTFSGDPIYGLWTLWGWGSGGVAKLSPVLFVGLVGLCLARRWVWLVAAAPWLVALCFHQTPWGGASNDHRYLLPFVPWLGVGLALALGSVHTHPRRTSLTLGIALLVVYSALACWFHTVPWR